jgi:ketosteroid isomerase-like protein
MSNLDTVKAMYDAFGRGDIPFILKQLRDDVDWDYDSVDHGIPWITPGRGRDLVGRFFAAIPVQLDMHSFEVLGFLEGESQVGVIVRSHWTVKSTGRDIRDLEVHLWTFDKEGRVSRFKHFIDTAVHAAASAKG